MDKKMRKALLFLLLFLCLPMIGCTKEEVDEKELFSSVEALIEESRVLNDIYFGEGIPTKENGTAIGVYREADMISLQAMGFTSIAQIRAKTQEVFSSGMCNWLFGRAFSALSVGNAVELARYYETADKGLLMVQTTAESYLNGDTVYDYTTLKLVSQYRDTVKVTLKATVTTEEGLSRTETIDVDLLKTVDGWRLDSPTYLVYAPEEDLRPIK